MEKNQDMLLEQQRLLSCLEIIRENIREYEEKEEVTQLFQAVKKGEGDSFGLLEAEKNILEHIQNSLRKNRAALNKAYFGRIDYDDESYGVTESRYIGKNGVTRNSNEVMIVDWRAPVSSVYYENELGKGSYEVPGSEPVNIRLFKKRTYDLQGEKLLGFYDNDTAASDELLVKYLSQHKEAVLGDIIATIQKEQNEIIRATPYKNMIVQGVAGSGKTTVALHRISYILYNYEEVYKPSEFCIVGSSDMLLNYISSGLPELDVNHVRQMSVPSLPHGKVLEEKVQHHRRRHQGLQKKQTGFCICTGMLFEKVDRETFEFTGYSGPGIRCDIVSREYAGYQKPKSGAVPVSVREAVEPANPSANSVFVYGKGRGISQRKAESVPELFLFF